LFQKVDDARTRAGSAVLARVSGDAGFGHHFLQLFLWFPSRAESGRSLFRRTKKEGICNCPLLISPGLSRLWWEYLFTKSFSQPTGTLANLRLLYRFRWFGYPL